MIPAADGAFAAWLAERTGQLLLDLRGRQGFSDPAGLRKAGDAQAHELLLAELGKWRPGDAVLSEEGVRDDPARLSSERVWIVDPLDGTREFGEPGRVDWAVHVALWAADHLAAGAVALPAQHLTVSTDAPPSLILKAAQSGLHDDAAAGAPMRIVTSRTRPPDFLPGLAAELGAELVPMGSAGAKICAVIAGDVDAYIHAGGQYEWDSAAPVAVAQAAGLHASRIDGSELRYNQPDPSLPDLLVCRRDLGDRLLLALSQHG